MHHRHDNRRSIGKGMSDKLIRALPSTATITISDSATIEQIKAIPEINALMFDRNVTADMVQAIPDHVRTMYLFHLNSAIAPHIGENVRVYLGDEVSLPAIADLKTKNVSVSHKAPNSYYNAIAANRNITSVEFHYELERLRDILTILSIRPALAIKITNILPSERDSVLAVKSEFSTLTIELEEADYLSKSECVIKEKNIHIEVLQTQLAEQATEVDDIKQRATTREQEQTAEIERLRMQLAEKDTQAILLNETIRSHAEVIAKANESLRPPSPIDLELEQIIPLSPLSDAPVAETVHNLALQEEIERNSTLMMELDRLRAQLAQLTYERNEIEAAVITTQVRPLQEQLKNEKAKAFDAEVENAHLLEELEKSKHAFNENTKDYSQRIVALISKIDSLHKALADKESTMTAKENAAAARTFAVAQQQKQMIDQLNVVIASLMTEVTKTQQQLFASVVATTKAENRLEEVTAKLNAERQQLNMFRISLQQKHAETIAEATQIRQQFDAKIAALEASLRASQQEEKNLQGTLAYMQQQLLQAGNRPAPRAAASSTRSKRAEATTGDDATAKRARKETPSATPITDSLRQLGMIASGESANEYNRAEAQAATAMELLANIPVNHSTDSNSPQAMKL